jgi:hypothetical protein
MNPKALDEAEEETLVHEALEPAVRGDRHPPPASLSSLRDPKKSPKPSSSSSSGAANHSPYTTFKASISDCRFHHFSDDQAMDILHQSHSQDCHLALMRVWKFILEKKEEQNH